MINPNVDDGSLIHFCVNGVILDHQSETSTVANWRAGRSQAISFLEWGVIAVRIDIVDGRGGAGS
jgi:hypothetical protein